MVTAIEGLSPDTFYRRSFTSVPDRAALVTPLLARVDHHDPELFVAWVD